MEIQDTDLGRIDNSLYGLQASAIDILLVLAVLDKLLGQDVLLEALPRSEVIIHTVYFMVLLWSTRVWKEEVT